jgi:hypothetical protein
MTMPKAAMDEYYLFPFGEGQVRSAGYLRTVCPKPVSGGMKQTTNDLLRFRVFPFD